MLRYVLLGGALSAIVTGTIISAPADASPICAWVVSTHPVPLTQSQTQTCVAYPLETICSHQTYDFGSAAYAEVHACVPNPQALPAL